jgi:ABC-type ATPase involved in cell division
VRTKTVAKFQGIHIPFLVMAHSISQLVDDVVSSTNSSKQTSKPANINGGQSKPSAVAPQAVSVTQVSDAERLSGKTSFDTIQAAVEGFNRDGFSVLTNAIDPAIVDKLNEKMLSRPTTT